MTVPEQAVATAAANWVIRKRGYFYRPNRCGYTASILEAGRYTEADARAEVATEPGTIYAFPASDYEDSLPPAALPLVGVQQTDVARALETMASDCEHLLNILERKAEQEWDYDYQKQRIDAALAILAALPKHTGQPVEGWLPAFIARQRAKLETITANAAWKNGYREALKNVESVDAALSPAPASPQPIVAEQRQPEAK